MKNIFRYFFTRIFYKNILLQQGLHRNYPLLNGCGKGKSYKNIRILNYRLERL